MALLKSIFKSLFTPTLKLSIILVILFSILGLLGKYYWLADLFSHFRMQYSIALVIALFLTIYKKLYKFIFFTLITLALNVYFLAPYYAKNNQNISLNKTNKEKTLKVLTFNVFKFNTNYTQVINFIKKTDADVVCLIEVNKKWRQNLKALEQMYPYHIWEHRESSFGIVMFSKEKPVDSQSLFMANIPTLLMTFEVNKELVHVIGSHPMQPIYPKSFTARNKTLDKLSEFTNKLSHNVVLMGDFNISPYSFIMRSFLQKTGLRDANMGNGFQPTWRRGNIFVNIPIDYILISKKIKVDTIKIGPRLGSDHSPIFAELHL